MASFNIQKYEDAPRCEPAEMDGPVGLEQHLAGLDKQLHILDDVLGELGHRLTSVLLPEEESTGAVPQDAPSRTPTADYVDSMTRRAGRLVREVQQIAERVYL